MQIGDEVESAEEIYFVEKLFDIDGDETLDPELAISFVAKGTVDYISGLVEDYVLRKNQ